MVLLCRGVAQSDPDANSRPLLPRTQHGQSARRIRPPGREGLGNLSRPASKRTSPRRAACRRPAGGRRRRIIGFHSSVVVIHQFHFRLELTIVQESGPNGIAGRSTISGQVFSSESLSLLPATLPSACKNPIIWFVVTTDLFPVAKSLQEGWMNWH